MFSHRGKKLSREAFSLTSAKEISGENRIPPMALTASDISRGGTAVTEKRESMILTPGEL